MIITTNKYIRTKHYRQSISFNTSSRTPWGWWLPVFRSTELLHEKVEEQARRGRCSVGTPPDLVDHLGDETDGLATTEGEKLNLGGTWHMIPLRLGDLDISFAGSCSGNQQEYFISCTVLRFSTMVLMVGLSDGSFWRHLCAMSATVLAALGGKWPLSWGSMISDSRKSSARKGRLHLTKFLSSLGWWLSRFFLPVSSSKRTIPKLHTLLFGVRIPFSNVSTDRFPTACTITNSWTERIRTKLMEYLYR